MWALTVPPYHPLPCPYVCIRCLHEWIYMCLYIFVHVNMDVYMPWYIHGDRKQRQVQSFFQSCLRLGLCYFSTPCVKLPSLQGS